MICRKATSPRALRLHALHLAHPALRRCLGAPLAGGGAGDCHPAGAAAIEGVDVNEAVVKMSQRLLEKLRNVCLLVELFWSLKQSLWHDITHISCKQRSPQSSKSFRFVFYINLYKCFSHLLKATIAEQCEKINV